MEKYLLLFIFICTTVIIEAADPIKCECGTHATSITTYTVTGEGCCDGIAGSHGFVYTYTLNQGVWQVSGETQVTGRQAQKRCCEAA